MYSLYLICSCEMVWWHQYLLYTTSYWQVNLGLGHLMERREKNDRKITLFSSLLHLLRRLISKEFLTSLSNVTLLVFWKEKSCFLGYKADVSFVFSWEVPFLKWQGSCWCCEEHPSNPCYEGGKRFPAVHWCAADGHYASWGPRY